MTPQPLSPPAPVTTDLRAEAFQEGDDRAHWTDEKLPDREEQKLFPVGDAAGLTAEGPREPPAASPSEDFLEIQPEPFM